MDRQQINRMAVDCRNGDEEALENLFVIINPMIERTSRELELLVEEYTKFDCRIVLKAKKLIQTFDERKDDFISIIKTLISREKSDFIRRRRKHLDEISLQYLEQDRHMTNGVSKDGHATYGVFALEDTTKESVEDELMYKELTALLSQGDPRKIVILNQWTKGANDKAISELLSQRFGGNSESHRTYISRFRNKCRKALS